MSAQFGLLLITGNQTHQENYARAFAADERCQLIGLADEAGIPQRRRELNRELADELGIPYLSDLSAAIGRDDVNVVSICAEPERRLPLTLACVEAGKHIYLDKDPAPTVDGAWQVANAIQNNGLLAQAFSMVRLPACQQAKQIVDSGELGELVGLHSDVTFAKGIPGTADLSRPRQENPPASRFTFTDSKREFLCVGYYPLILFQWLTGQRFDSVDAVTSNYFFEAHQKNDVEDFASVLLRMDGGTEATITAGRCGWMSHRDFGVHDIRLVGTRGSITIDAQRPRLEVCSDTAPWTQPATGHPEDPMGFWSSTQKTGGIHPKQDWQSVNAVAKSDAAAFLDCLEQNQQSDVTAAMAAHTVDVVHATYRSAASRQSEPIAKSESQA
ncbi:MAG: Gfo/Idh/MocA family oxidoreductase [Planctomycetota bacterium]|nr:Gfo/Idh/MocA family oxidoreductase [Planctomycetota bacterium]MDA1162668.1 Gfo/Idh/MocA family oxidoreductase [Planctomycetota bacterium]